MNDRTAEFASARPLLFSIAYRMVGSVMDAEDLVQDAFIKWQEAPDADIRAPQAYLTTIVTRLAIDQLRSARAKRETYVGPWLPEPLVTEHSPDPSGPVELAESLSMAFLVMLERLSPVERAIFVLREAFDFEFPDIARILAKTETNCRQILLRARKRLGKTEARFQADPAAAERLLDRFAAATRAGDLSAMVAVLADDITLWADGGGKAKGAARRPVRGRTRVARFLLGARRRFPPGGVIRRTRINGQPGFIVYASGRPLVAVIYDIRGDRIHTIYSVSNPEKLQKLPAPAQES
ncbi:MAG TPA: RNA polymerase sigma-70 factor [Gemmatimonadales bacterium]|nr:RNA polymerase sigma-70 factor [Gemmatimonadales bacterium]